MIQLQNLRCICAEQVRQGVVSRHLDLVGREVSFILPVGERICDRLGLAGECLRGAEQALDEGKRAGDDRVVCAPVPAAVL